MLSPRRSAQLGLLGVATVVTGCLSVLLARSDMPDRLSPIGRVAAPIVLQDTDGHTRTLESYRGKIVVLWFNSIRCSTTNQYAARVAKLTRDFAGRSNIQVIAIHVGDADSPEAIAVQAQVAGMNCPIWLDRDGSVAAAYDVTHTPTFVVIGRQGLIRYHGAQDDDATAAHVTQRYVRQAVAALLKGEAVPTESTQAPGCLIATGQ